VYAQFVEEELRGECLPEFAMAISDLISCASWFVVFDMEIGERIWDYFVPVGAGIRTYVLILARGRVGCLGVGGGDFSTDVLLL